MDEEEVARRLRTRARAWRGAQGSAGESRWAQQGQSRRPRWAWLPALTALVFVALFSAAAAAYAGGPAPVRRALAPVGDRVTRPWHATPAADGQTEKLPSEPSPGPKTSPASTAPSVEPPESAPRAAPPAKPEASASFPKSKEDSGSRPDNKRHASPQPSSPSSEPSSPGSKPSSPSPEPGTSSPEPGSPNRDG